MQVSTTHRRVIYEPLPDTDRILTLIPEARRLATGQVAVPLEMRASQVMRHLGHPAASPIEYFYDWPCRFPKPRPNQLVTAAFKTLYPRNVDTSDMRCVDAETEYLSPTGWRRMDQYAGGKVAQYVLSTGAAEFVEPIDYHVSPCIEMYRFKTYRGVDQMLSAGHRVLYRNHRTGELLLTTPEAIAVREATTIKGWPGRFLTTFKSPGGYGLDLTNAALRVQVALIADGSFSNKQSESKVCRVGVKKGRKKQRLRQLLTHAEIPFSEHEYEGRPDFIYFQFEAPRRDKKFSEYYWSATPAQLAVIADEVAHWDSHVKASGVVVFSSSESKSAEFIQYAFAGTGRTASLRRHTQRAPYEPIWIVTAWPHARELCLAGWTDQKVKTEPVSLEPTPDGKMYCFQVPSTFLVFRRNGCIFVSGNTGKTLSSLWAADYLMSIGLVHKALILSPLSTLQRVWESEVLQSFFGRRKVAILHGDRERRLKRLAQDADFLVLNHDGLSIGCRREKRQLVLGPLVQEIIKREDIDLLIIDELSIYKHHTSTRYKVVQAMLDAKPRMWRWGLTGTPAGTQPTDAWAQGRLIYGKQARPEGFETFQFRTMIQVSEFKWRPKPEASQLVAAWLQPSVRFTRKELGFPALSYEVRDVALSSAQIAAYKAMKKDLEMTTERGMVVEAANEAVLRTKLIQIACGAIYDADHNVHRIDAGPRMQEVMDIIEEAGGKFLIFAPLTSVVEIIAEKLKKVISTEIINGNVSASKRNTIFTNFQDKADPRVLVCDPRAMAHGLNLTAASTIVWFAPTDNLELYEQANARIDGPEACGVVIQLSSSPVEREMYRRQQEKQSLQGSILHLLREAA